jgi:hypothetical protein
MQTRMSHARTDIWAEQMNFTAVIADYQKAIESYEVQIQRFERRRSRGLARKVIRAQPE